MHQLKFEIHYKAPEATDFAQLRALIGWTNPPLETLSISLENSHFWVTVYCDNQLIGTGRIVGDGAMYYYIQDVIVHPQYQGLGVGAQLMEAIEDYVRKQCQSGSTVGLLAAYGKEGFYQKYGYTSRDGSELGLGMCKFI